jgi:hypothetical protein
VRDGLRLADLPHEVRSGGDPSAPSAAPVHLDPRGLMPLEEVIRAHVAHVFRACNENVTHTARVLGISRVSLRRRLNEYGIRRGGPVEGSTVNRSAPKTSTRPSGGSSPTTRATSREASSNTSPPTADGDSATLDAGERSGRVIPPVLGGSDEELIPKASA